MGRLIRIPYHLTGELRLFMSTDFLAYAEYVHGLRAAPFQERWAGAMADAGIPRLVVVAPPESGKTAWCIAYCCWIIGKDPSIHVGYVGNTASQALRQSVAVRDTIRTSPRFREIFPDITLDEPKGTSEREWFVHRPDPGDKDATFIVSGFRGPLLGARLDMVVLDDYSDSENTATPEQQERAWEWLQQNVFTRLNPDQGRLICIQTRWAEGDVVGHLEEVGAKVLQFSAYAETGEPLWPARWGKAGLEARRREMGSRLFDLHYMSVIHPPEGNVFKHAWWASYRPGEALTKPQQIVLSLDTAYKVSQTADYSAATVWARRDRRHYLVHLWKGRVEFPDLIRKVVEIAAEHKATHVLIEDAGSGQSLVQELKQRSGLNVLALKAEGDKFIRTVAVTPEVESGRVFLPEGLSWRKEFEYELETFPHGQHDDLVDSTVQYLTWARSRPTEGGRLLTPFLMPSGSESHAWDEFDPQILLRQQRRIQ